ncbi:penicillin acylase family protein [Daejeonella lutea]|uniref:Acyl-homoserine lactone (AHL) acylase PvdQ n=1 Tax=Daejeonella lutea TaxID=572036 RepID=A0A1T5EA33_9SPHI|nr:penicillin acylase family protein [Daejeonella lutea]SKB80857.1 Acyl-homoserine lactone (AHL) acylase PvdQ [Daejeonella lutea]
MKSPSYYLGLAGLLLLIQLPSLGLTAQDLADQVVIRRTAYGVPHIKAENMQAAGFGLGYVQLEDYGRGVVDGMVRARGEWSQFHDMNAQERAQSLDRDASNKLRYSRAVETFSLLRKETQDVLIGFAAGMNRYIERHKSEFPEWIKPNFTGYDVHAQSIGGVTGGSVQGFMRTLQRQNANSRTLTEEVGMQVLEGSTVWARLAEKEEAPHPDEGSNAFALAPSRTTSGRAILLRNPHLAWNAGYYEAQLEVPGILNFYGDFRIGGPLITIGGYNERLGFSTTNNDPDSDEIYSFQVSPTLPDHFLIDGTSLPIEKKRVSVKFKNGEGSGEETREFLFTPFGPVFHRENGKIYVIRDAGNGEYRLGEQFLMMMKARNLAEYKEAMRIQAKTSSNFTYADADGNIYYVWNAMTPDLPHPSGGDTSAIAVTRSDQVWRNIIPFDKLPQLLNPKGGYLHNENDPFHYTNLNEVIDASKFPPHFSQPILRLRSQHALDMIANKKKFSLEDVVKLKYSQRMLLAERVKADLIAAVKKSSPTGEIADALKQMEDWDNTVNRESKGGVLFEIWWEHYVELSNGGKRVPGTAASVGFPAPGNALFAEVWTPAYPATTPKGLASESRAVEAFIKAVETAKKRYGSWDLAWGDVNRARIAGKDIPISGATGELGTFSVLWFIPHKTDKMKRETRGGDGWVIAVEFGKTPRAYSVLTYGESNKDGSPYFADQLELYANKQMKKVAFTEEDIKKGVIKEYRPGQE